MSGSRTLKALFEEVFVSTDFVGVFGDDLKTQMLLDALDNIDRSMAYCIADNMELMLANPVLLTSERVWRLVFTGQALVDAMLTRDNIPNQAWLFALQHVPSRRVKVADKLLADGTLVMMPYIAMLVPQRAHRAWRKLWGPADKQPTLRVILDIAEANPTFKSTVADMLLEGYPAGRKSAKSMAWVKRHGLPHQQSRAQAILDLRALAKT
jgi:hypothetical protein